MPRKFTVSLAEAQNCMVDDDMEGICLFCGERQSGVEPDAMNYHCDECGQNQVWGIEQAVMAGKVDVT